MRERGVNRISLGVQSFDEQLKGNCNRHDTVEQDLAAFQAARDAGFQNISIDMLCGLPKQSMESWEDSVAQLLDLAPEHACVEDVLACPRRLPLGRLRAGYQAQLRDARSSIPV
ncbi:MAG: radical SAM protein [Planctomycetota bacterium]